MKIVNYKDLNKGNITSSFDVIIEEWGLTIKRCGLFSAKGNRFIGFPSYKYEVDGQAKYSPYIFMEKSRKDRFDKAIIEMLDSGNFQRLEDSKKTEQKPEEECPF